MGCSILQRVAQIILTEWTNYGLLRHATLEVLRDDNERRGVVREITAAQATSRSGRARFVVPES